MNQGIGDNLSPSQNEAAAQPLQKVTLEPLCPLNPHALDTQGIPCLNSIKLTRVKYVDHNTPPGITTVESDDLIASAQDPEHPKLVPQGADPIDAKMRFYFAGATDAPTVEIHPPSTITVHGGSFSKTISQWLSKSPFNASNTFTAWPIIALLSIAFAAAPAFDDNDGDDDDDDCDGDRIVHCSRPSAHVSRFTFYASRFTSHAPISASSHLST